jgi:hypothetical protein
MSSILIGYFNVLMRSAPWLAQLVQLRAVLEREIPLLPGTIDGERLSQSVWVCPDVVSVQEGRPASTGNARDAKDFRSVGNPLRALGANRSIACH